MSNSSQIEPRPLIFYHDSCFDGYGAAFAAWSKFGDNADYHATKYGTRYLPEVEGRRVYILDFSFSRATLLDMNEKADRVILLDHHKTAKEDVGDLPFCMFNLDQSGAMMAWKYFFPNQEKQMPWFIPYIQDRDLWQHKLTSTKEVNADISSWPKDFKFWETKQGYIAYPSSIDDGQAILRYKRRQMEENVARITFVNFAVDLGDKFDTGFVHIPCINMADRTISESLEAALIQTEEPFAIGWYQQADGRFAFSLRSRNVNIEDAAVDVSAIAKAFGGGGHAAAAGFVLNDLPDWLLE